MNTDIGSMIELEEKAISETDDCWTFTGYAAVFNNIDRGNDIIVPGAFAKSLRENGMPLLCYQHDLKEVVGTVVDAKEDKRGLWIKGELPKDDDFVRGRLVPQLKRRGIRGMSIGYKAVEKERRKSDGVRLLKQIRLYEASFVSLPMNPEAGVDTIKGIVPFQDLPIADPASWDADAAMQRIEAKFAAGDIEDMRRAFLFWDEEADKPEGKYLIADVDDKGCLVANRVALFKAVAALQGSRKSGDDLPEGAEDAIKHHLERYYQRLDLESPFKSFSKSEFESLDWGEREARLRHLGISRSLAKDLVEGLKRATQGQRDADRKSVQQAPAGLSEEATTLLTALSEIVGVAAAIKTSSRS